jgi:protein O-GlcNAc transferase
MQELVAATPADYVAIAARLASDPRRLADLRSTLRQRMRAAPLTDRQRFMRNLEQAYRSVWRAWCSERKL